MSLNCLLKHTILIYENIFRLPADIVDFPNMQTLRIANNPFKDIPMHYAKADTVRLLLYLRERQTMELETQTVEEGTDQAPLQSLPNTRFSL